MGLRINTNVSSMQAQNSLNRTTTRLNQSLTRLSTGLRINSGKDDTVGLAQSESLRSQIRGVAVAQGNISRANSVLGVAEGAASQLTDILQQMREVAVQASDNTISSSDRTALTTKFSDLSNEYSRIATGTNFGGVRLLDGTFTSKSLQIGPDQGNTLSISLSDVRSSTIGTIAITTSSVVTAEAASNGSINFTDPPATITINGYSLATSAFSADGVSYTESDESAIAYVTAINSISGSTGVVATALSNVFTIYYTASANGTAALTSGSTLKLNNVAVWSSGSFSIAASGHDTAATTLTNAINNNALQTGVTATLDSSANTITLTASDGRNIDFLYSGAASKKFLNINSTTTNLAFVQRGKFKLTSASAFTTSGTMGGVSATSVSTSSSTSLSNASLTSSTNAADAVSIIDNAISQMQTRRGTIGSTSNRLDIASAELASRSENLSSAESAIRDADIASETARLTQYQILQQAGVTVLGQANSAPQIALSLLQNL